MRFRGPDLAVLLGLLVVLGAAGAPASESGAEIYVRDDDGQLRKADASLSEDVLDPVFAFLMAVLERDLYGVVDTAWFDSLATAEGGSRMPYESIVSLDRWPGDEGVDAVIRLKMGDRTEFDIPYSILGYNPGSMRFSQEIEFVEWKIGDRDLEFDLGEDEDRERVLVPARDAHLFIISAGSLALDIDGWVDRLLGSKLDDVDMVGFFVFRDGDEFVGLGFGYNPKGSGRTGAFDFKRNESIFPASKGYLAVGRTMRALAEQRLERWKQAGGGVSVTGSAPVTDTPR